MARRDPREDRPRHHRFPRDHLAGRHRRQSPRRRHAERRHGLAEKILPQNRPKRGASVATAREGRRTGPLELDVPAQTVAPDHFAEQNGATIAQLRREAAELMPGIGLRDRLRPFRDGIAAEDGRAFCAFEGCRIDPQALRKRSVYANEARTGNRRRLQPGEKALGQARIGVVERNMNRHGLSSRTGAGTVSWRPRSRSRRRPASKRP